MAAMKYDVDVLEVDPTMPALERLDILMEWIEFDSRDPEIVALSRGVVAAAVRSGRAQENDPVGHLQALLDWQNRAIRYQEDPTDPDTGWQLELFKRPTRSIFDQEDDCEGKVAVYCTMATAAGYASMPVWIEQKGSRNNHVAGLSAVPLWAAARIPPCGDYEVVVLRPSHPPAVRDSTWVWGEMTLSDVPTPAGVLPGPRIGEHPYDVLARFRAAGVSRMHL